MKSHFPTHILGQSQSHFTPSGPSFKAESVYTTLYISTYAEYVI